MANIYPFKAFLYNQRKLHDLSSVVTQPYDKISPEMQDRYYALSPYNVVRIIRGKNFPDDTTTDNVYTRARNYLDQWIEEDVFKQMERPALFAYFQEYALPDSPSERRARKGFIGLGKIEDYSAGVVFPHERTLAAPKADRFELLSATGAHPEQIFMLYFDPQRTIEKILDDVSQAPPSIRVRDEYDVTHSVWAITDSDRISLIRAQMRDKKLIIADGHHRYETALAYRNDRRSKSNRDSQDDEADYEQVMMTFINAESAGLTILPTHRLVSNVSEFDLNRFLTEAGQFFVIRQYPFSNKQEPSDRLVKFRADLASEGRRRPTVGAYAIDALYLLTLRQDFNFEKELPEVSSRQRALDVVLLHQLLLRRCLGITDEAVTKEKHLTYLREFEVGVKRVQGKEASICFFLNPTPIEQVREVAFSGETLPQKSTDFYPKLLSGLAIYKLER